MLVPDREGGLCGLGVPGAGGLVSDTQRPAGKSSASLPSEVDRSMMGPPFDARLQKHSQSAWQLWRVFCFHFVRLRMIKKKRKEKKINGELCTWNPLPVDLG